MSRRANPYKEQGRTIVTQVSTSLTRITTRSALFRQSASCNIPDGEAFNNVDLNVAVDTPHVIPQVNHLLYIKTPHEVYVEFTQDGQTVRLLAKGLFMLNGAIEGEVKITSALTEPVMCNLVYS